jgi:predicted permease
VSTLLRDLRFGLRLLARSPVFTATSVLLLAIGISANTLIFSAVDALLLRKLPVTRPDELVRIVQVHPTGFVNWHFAYELCEKLAGRRSSFSAILCQGQADVPLRDGENTERVRAHLVSPNFFSDLGVGAQLGRVLVPEDERAEVMPAVLSDGFWKRRFKGDPAIIGRSVTLNGYPFVVVGVSLEGFNGLTIDTSPDIRVPATADRWFALQASEGASPEFVPIYGEVFGRLRRSVSLERAEAEMELLAQSVAEDLPESVRKWSANAPNRLEPIANGVSVLREQFQRGLLALTAGVGLLLAMACANVAGLLLARSAIRTTEMGVRLTLGASRWRVARQLLVENLPLALLGGLAGILLTYACLPLLVRALPPIRDRAAVLQPLAVHIDVNLRILAFAVVVTLLSIILFGLSPALAGARTQVAHALRSGRTTTRRLSLQKLIVATQVAARTLLLIGAALLVETFTRMRSMDPGFDRDHIVTFTVDPRMKGYQPEQALRLSQGLLDKSRSLPSVAAASIAGRALMRGTGVKGTFAPAGEQITTADFLNCSMNFVMPEYFEAMGMRVIAGRDFSLLDSSDEKPRKVIVNQALVRRFFPSGDPIGRLIGGSASGSVARPDMEIIGVVSDARYRSLREGIHPTIYNRLVGDLEMALSCIFGQANSRRCLSRRSARSCSHWIPSCLLSKYTRCARKSKQLCGRSGCWRRCRRSSE